MALTELQRRICRVIAANRIAIGESYVAGGVALNALTRGSRISRDIDLFHDTRQALDASWTADRAALKKEQFTVEVIRERSGFVEARIREGESSVLMQWAEDSAYRFFPLVEHEELGLTLHPFDLATNKVLALIGRAEIRDWIDIMTCNDRIQPLGYLVWAACGKDPGFNPSSILDQAARTARYTQDELRLVLFDDGNIPDAAELSRKWHEILKTAGTIVDCLPSKQAGQCVLGKDYDLFKGDIAALKEDLKSKSIRFHSGCIRGALPALLQER